MKTLNLKQATIRSLEPGAAVLRLLATMIIVQCAAGRCTGMFLDKVFKGLECCKDTTQYNCPQCPYFNDEDEAGCDVSMLMEDAYYFLKKKTLAYRAQYGATGVYCGYCTAKLNGHEHYCSQCGRRVKWDE